MQYLFARFPQSRIQSIILHPLHRPLSGNSRKMQKHKKEKAPYDSQASLVKVGILACPILEAVEQLVGRLVAAMLLHLALAAAQQGKVNLKCFCVCVSSS